MRLTITALAFAGIFIGGSGVPAVRAQSLAFDVVSVKPVLDEGSEVMPKRSGGRIAWTSDLSHIISYGYHLQFRNISGSFPNAPNFRIEAIFDPTATEDQVRLMVVTLLRNRFEMEAHRVTKEIDGYGLFVGKNGLKVKEVTAEAKHARSASTLGADGWVAALLLSPGLGEIQARGGSVPQLVEALQRAQPQMVWDHTGLRGIYDFDFRYATDASPDVDAPTLESALRDTLGLELRKQKGPLETLVVDSIEKEPTGN